MINLLQNAVTFQPTLYQKLQPLATWEEVQELAAKMEETQEQTVQKALSLVAQNNRQALSQIQEELEKEQASRETFQQQVGKEQERFTSKLSEEFSAWKNELEDFQQQTERRWRQLRRRFTLGLLLSWALACGALWMLLPRAVMENEEEDEEQRRERIQAEENGQDLGAAPGNCPGAGFHVAGERGPSSPGGGPCFYYVIAKEAALTKREITKSLKEYPAAPHGEGAGGDSAGEHQNRV